ncbi:MAG: response regulator transcription factor [Deltaproteobacteria bacterium]
MARHVLILEDDRELGAQLVRHLEKAGLTASWMEDGATVDADTLRGVDLVVLDIMLPSVNGLDLLEYMRTFSDVPVLVLSARNETADKVRGLKLGADDYMTKPFWPDEFLERVRARLRRPTLERSDRLEVGPLAIDRAARRAFLNHRPLTLTRVELELLLTLAERPGAAVTRRALADRVLDPDGDGDERTLDVHVSRIRKKLGDRGLIETVWGIGYRLAAETDA